MDLKMKASMVLPVAVSKVMDRRFISLGFRKPKALSKAEHLQNTIICLMQIPVGIFMVMKHMVSSLKWCLGVSFPCLETFIQIIICFVLSQSMLRGRGGCYKHTFYGIESHRCMETTPSLACANKCVFCWR